MKNATRVVVSTFGAIFGVAGIEHGIGEVLQGNAAPDGIMILSWPGSTFFRGMGGEPAMTIVPNLLVTGILAILFSLSFLVWATVFVQRKNGGLVLILLSVAMLLLGGGLFPPVLGIIIGAVGTRIGEPLTWWRAHLPVGLRAILASIWPWSLVAGLLAWLSLFPGTNILDYYFGVSDPNVVLISISCAFGLLPLAIIAGFARDIQSRPYSAQAKPMNRRRQVVEDRGFRPQA